MIVFGPLADVISLKTLMLVSGIVLVMLGFHTFRKKISITGMLIQMQRQISSQNGRQRHERNMEINTNK